MARNSVGKQQQQGRPSIKPSSAGKGANDSMLMEFFSEELKDIYYAEKHILKTLPKMIKAAHSPELQQAFQEHLEVTKNQVVRLEEVFAAIDKKPQAKKCDAIEGITKEGEGAIEETQKGTATRDVALIMIGQKVEHYEIATYGGLAQLARTLGLEDAAELLNTTLEEEKEADSSLSSLAESDINYESSQESSDEEDEDEDE